MSKKEINVPPIPPPVYREDDFVLDDNFFPGHNMTDDYWGAEVVMFTRWTWSPSGMFGQVEPKPCFCSFDLHNQAVCKKYGKNDWACRAIALNKKEEE